jgi:hypothetical protein
MSFESSKFWGKCQCDMWHYFAPKWGSMGENRGKGAQNAPLDRAETMGKSKRRGKN